MLDNHGGKGLARAVRAAYTEGQADYTMAPLKLTDAHGAPVGNIGDGDAVIFCCRRGEREIELTDAFTADAFTHFTRKKLENLDFVILTMYHEKFKALPIAFAPSSVADTLAARVSGAGLSQMHCAESEKYAHVTYFFNGGSNNPFPGERDVRIPSPRGVPFDTVPALSLPAVAEAVREGIAEGFGFIVANFANGDVIGHTANMEAKRACAACVDTHLGEVVEAAKARGYVILITADHGNLEVGLSADGKPHVAHTANPVPLFLIDPLAKHAPVLRDGALSGIAPTVLQALGLSVPKGMTGESLAPEHDFGAGRKVLLLILDGWGLGAQDETNPIYAADTPVWDALAAEYPMARLNASGGAVGLQDGKAGNSEAGHINMGAGRVVMQDDVRLDAAMKDGSFEQNEVFLQAIDRAKARGAALHLIALLTKKSSHGSVDYPLALLRMAKARGMEEVFVHVIFDGRSTQPGSAPALLEELDAMMAQIGIGLITDGVGRGIALDRDGNYAKIQQAYSCMVMGKGRPYTL